MAQLLKGELYSNCSPPLNWSEATRWGNSDLMQGRNYSSSVFSFFLFLFLQGIFFLFIVHYTTAMQKLSSFKHSHCYWATTDNKCVNLESKVVSIQGESQAFQTKLLLSPTSCSCCFSSPSFHVTHVWTWHTFSATFSPILPNHSLLIYGIIVRPPFNQEGNGLFILKMPDKLSREGPSHLQPYSLWSNSLQDLHSPKFYFFLAFPKGYCSKLLTKLKKSKKESNDQSSSKEIKQNNRLLPLYW